MGDDERVGSMIFSLLNNLKGSFLILLEIGFGAGLSLGIENGLRCNKKAETTFQLSVNKSVSSVADKRFCSCKWAFFNSISTNFTDWRNELAKLLSPQQLQIVKNAHIYAYMPIYQICHYMH